MFKLRSWNELTPAEQKEIEREWSEARLRRPDFALENVRFYVMTQESQKRFGRKWNFFVEP